jgi:mevalonate kinase
MAIATAVGKVTVGSFAWDKGKGRAKGAAGASGSASTDALIPTPPLSITLSGFEVTVNVPSTVVRNAVEGVASGGGWGSEATRAADIPSSLRKAADRAIELTEKSKESPALKPTARRASSALLALFLALALRREGATLGSTNDSPPMQLTIDTDLPIGAGLGSSASFAVTAAAGLLALLDMWACKAGGPKRARAGTACATCAEALRGQRQQCSAQLDLINDWAYQVERILHGTPSGIDNATITYGGYLTMEKGKFAPVAAVPALDFLIVDTQVPDRSTARLVAGVHAFRAAHPASGTALIGAIDAIAREAITVLSKQTGAVLNEHLVDLIRANQGTLDALGVGHPRITTVLSVAASQGLTGKLTGAGGGGCVLILIPPSSSQAGAAERCMRELISMGFSVFRTKLGAPGVMVEETK